MLSVEAAELLQPFQWLQIGDVNELDTKNIGHITHEVADVLIYLIYLIRLADKLNIDLMAGNR